MTDGLQNFYTQILVKWFFQSKKSITAYTQVTFGLTTFQTCLLWVQVSVHVHDFNSNTVIRIKMLNNPSQMWRGSIIRSSFGFRPLNLKRKSGGTVPISLQVDQKIEPNPSNSFIFSNSDSKVHRARFKPAFDL